MGAEFLEIVTVGLGIPASLFRHRWPTVDESRLVTRELSVHPPVVGLAVCPCSQLPQGVTVHHEVD